MKEPLVRHWDETQPIDRPHSAMFGVIVGGKLLRKLATRSVLIDTWAAAREAQIPAGDARGERPAVKQMLGDPGAAGGNFGRARRRAVVRRWSVEHALSSTDCS